MMSAADDATAVGFYFAGLEPIRFRGIVRCRRETLDRGYLEQSASKLGLAALLERALKDA